VHPENSAIDEVRRSRGVPILKVREPAEDGPRELVHAGADRSLVFDARIGREIGLEIDAAARPFPKDAAAELREVAEIVLPSGGEA
jgi:hypothetical protein